MNLKRKPYLIIPKLIQQPTWGGGFHISHLKSWENKTIFKDKKIGQSYELYGNSKMLLLTNNSSDPRFIPEIGWADNPEIIDELFPFQKNTDYLILSELTKLFPEDILGKVLAEKYGKMPLLIKITEAKGNSYQIHIKSFVKHRRWQPKAESWYYLKNGLITFGIKEGINLEDYKKTCQEIETKMKSLSKKIIEKKISQPEAEGEALLFINKLSPRQYVNFHQINKDDLIDLSPGGVHHSWEEDLALCPDGNFLYEVQQDVMDPVSTIRCFDQGKFKEDGSIREIHIEDYFRLLDANPKHNDINGVLCYKKGSNLLTTAYYSLDILEVKKDVQNKTNGSFNHLFVREGKIEVIAEQGSVILTSGHSCLIPEFVKSYEIKTKTPLSVILKTYIS